jgi:23S rRNA pseudouridine1911/1915/1917 synthase
VTRELVAEAGAATERLDVFLAARLGTSRSAAAKLLAAGAVSVNGAAERPSYLVAAGDRVVVEGGRTSGDGPPAAEPPQLPVVYEDPDIIVIDKPAGLAAHPGAGHPAGRPTVADFARPRTTDPDPARPGIVHRLDRDTSGLMIIAKTLAAQAAMQQQFRDHAVRKNYMLLAAGRVSPPEAVIKLPIGRDPARPLRRAVVSGGRPAVTRYRTLADYSGYSLIEARPETGRTHQLRVHFAAIGHPIAGDRTYGAPAVSAASRLGLNRQFLHATALQFTAPSGAKLSLHSPLPPDLAAAVKTLEGDR